MKKITILAAVLITLISCMPITGGIVIQDEKIEIDVFTGSSKQVTEESTLSFYWEDEKSFLIVDYEIVQELDLETVNAWEDSSGEEWLKRGYETSESKAKVIRDLTYWITDHKYIDLDGREVFHVKKVKNDKFVENKNLYDVIILH